MKEVELYKLVRTFSKADRRRFSSCFPNSGKTPEYQKLYHILLKYPSISEAEIQIKISKRGKPFSDVKRDLKKAVDTFFLFPRSSANLSPENHFYLAQEYSHRNCWCLAAKEAQKSKKQAYALEDFSLILKIIQLQRLLPDPINLIELKSEAATVREVIHEIHQFENFMDEVSNFDQSSKIKGPALKQWDSILLHPVLQSPDQALSKTSKFLAYQLSRSIYYWKRDFGKAYKSGKNACQILEEHQDIFTNWFELSVRELSTTATLAALNGNLQDFHTRLDKVKNLVPANHQQKAKKLQAFFLPRFLIKIQEKKFIEASNYAILYQPEIEEISYLIPRKSQLLTLFHFARLKSIMGNYEGSISSIQEFEMVGKSEKTYREFLPFITVLEIFNLIKLDKVWSANRRLIFLKRMLQRTNNPFEYFELIIHFFEANLKSTNQALCPEVKMRLIELHTDSQGFEYKPFTFFNPIPYLDSLLENKPVHILLQNNNRGDSIVQEG